ncbi:bifunctional diaminohydroxyphosphoribosylaminopyrimidine deaminase/5-amino-6-(5-phosphoribosylamino)uracil reductase RibD [Flagellimonas sp.]|uniref:bifunctional diaminohydroxyphosphoribosylaminopyrimidine deaminase/5-amino-6-(5-phosphoribosylamino)uracil reductase RibD n=1 Tax=Flagellimonas sp. TaxID=2058762 RepID=UPI003B503BBD
MELGKKGLGNTAPNPMVGSVIVYQNKIIGEGFTSPYGGNHAEVNAIESVADKSLLSKSTLYVTLEPCSHHGKTPPCADLIAKHQIPEVVIGLKDPHSKVSGRGIEKLQQAGCSVQLGILESECRWHHRRFLTFHEENRPYIVLKWAESKDGFIAPDPSKRKKNPQPFWITNTYSKQLVHQWRSQEQAILVGTNTVLEDNPKLTARNWKGKHPVRVILDSGLRIPKEFHAMDGSVRTIVLTQKEDRSKHVDKVDYEVIDFSKPLASQICKVLHKHQITSLLVEGGSQTLQTFLEENLWDEAKVFTGPVTFENGISAPKVSGNLKERISILSDTLATYTND